MLMETGGSIELWWAEIRSTEISSGRVGLGINIGFFAETVTGRGGTRERAHMNVQELTVNQLEELLDASLRIHSEAHRTEALVWYEPANPALLEAHNSLARIVGVFGGNRSGKSEFGAVETAVLATGIIPRALRATYPVEKLRYDVLRGLHIRVACGDFINGITKGILPKFRDGDDQHGPWIPQRSLAGGNWEKAYNAASRTLTVIRETNTN